MRTYVAKPLETQEARKWWVIDASGQPLGRLASRIATVLRGKHKPSFTPHVDTGDFVIVVNANKVRLTGSKAAAKAYYRHTGHPGGIYRRSFSQLVTQRPEVPVLHAVRGMLPKNVLGRKMLTKLKVYGPSTHPHQAQRPEPLAL
jgi:large subunit ribosomal protein L13